MLDSAAGWYVRGTAARLLAIADPSSVTASLLDLFFTQTDKIELWEQPYPSNTPGTPPPFPV
jgi:hypothetical protein